MWGVCVTQGLQAIAVAIEMANMIEIFIQMDTQSNESMEIQR